MNPYIECQSNSLLSIGIVDSVINEHRSLQLSFKSILPKDKDDKYRRHGNKLHNLYFSIIFLRYFPQYHDEYT